MYAVLKIENDKLQTYVDRLIETVIDLEGTDVMYELYDMLLEADDLDELKVITALNDSNDILNVSDLRMGMGLDDSNNVTMGGESYGDVDDWMNS